MLSGDRLRTFVKAEGIDISPGNSDYAPEEAYRVATEIVEKEPSLLPEVIQWRWRMELNRGTVDFDPNDPNSYREVAIGRYIKRIIPDRIQPKSEEMSGPDTSVYVPFEQKPSDFVYTMARPGQKLLSIVLEKTAFDIYASNSPLTKAPHTLLVPQDLRPQFMLPIDLQVISVLQARYPLFSFMYSSMGGGAGVNQQHWHMIADSCTYPVLAQPIEFRHQARAFTIGQYCNWPSDSLILGGDADYKTGVLIEFIELLQQLNVPHNLFVKRWTWLNPRSRLQTALIPGKKFGTWESILGICNACSQEEYDKTDAYVFEQALNMIQLRREQKEKFACELLKIARNFF